jgi:ATP-dependent DNA ligase
MAPSALRRSERQYTYVQNAPAQRLARELRGVTGRSLPGLHRAHAAHVGPQAAERGHVAHQIKYDGYRVQVQVRQIAVRFLTRRGHDWTTGFQALAAAASGLKTYAAVLDGEVIVPGPNGTSDFGALQEDLGAKRSDRMIFCAFDVLYLDGLDLRNSVLEPALLADVEYRALTGERKLTHPSFKGLREDLMAPQARRRRS